MNKYIYVSFIVPIFNEELKIRKTILSILKQNTSVEFEIIIIDGMSNDKTRKILRELKSLYSNIILLNNEKKIVSVGFNKGLSISKGQIIIRVDGHSTLKSDFVKNCIDTFGRVNADCVGGPTNHVSQSYIGDLIKIAQTSKFGTGGVSFRSKITNGKYVNTLAFGAYKRDIFKKIGGYDEELIRNQDDEFNFRLIQNGGTIWIDPLIKSSYYSRDSILKFIKQYFQYGFYKVRVMQKRSSLASIRHIMPASFVSSLIFSLIFYYLLDNHFVFFSLIFPYIFLALSASMVGLNFKIKNLFSVLPLSFIYFAMHFSYGFGSLLGLLFFIKKWGSNKTFDINFDKNLFSKI